MSTEALRATPMRWLRVLLAAALLPILAACGTPTMKPEQAAAIQRVGIVSLLPSDLRYDKIGITVFNNERTTRPVGEALNAAARGAAERTLRQSGRQAVQLAVDAPALARRIRSAAIHFDSPAEHIGDELRQLARTHKLDAVVVIAESFDAENGIHGVRMFLRAGAGDIRFAVASGDIMTIAVDPNAKKLAGQGRGASSAVQRPQGQPWKYQLEENLDPLTQARVNAELVEVIGYVVEQHLRTMGF